MMEAPHREALEVLGKTFEDRIRQPLVRERERGTKSHLAFVLPVSVEEVQLLAEVTGYYSVPLVTEGARSPPGLETVSEQESILVRFDLMRRTQLPADADEPWAWAEPGAPGLELNDELLARGRSLAVYPTSAPRATAGGWLATDGLGIGSFEYGWLRENVFSASVVLPDGKRREVPGGELDGLLAPGGTRGVVVGVKFRTRQASRDVSFAAAFRDVGDLTDAAAEAVAARLPLWHLAFLSPAMACARNLGGDYLLFGAYPGERGEHSEERLRSAMEHHRGALLSAADAFRVWGQRLLSVAPSRPSPNATREFASVAGLREVLAGKTSRGVQGTVARSGEVLLLTLNHSEGGSAR